MRVVWETLFSTGLVPSLVPSYFFKKLSIVFTFGSEAICSAVRATPALDEVFVLPEVPLVAVVVFEVLGLVELDVVVVVLVLVPVVGFVVELVVV